MNVIRNMIAHLRPVVFVAILVGLMVLSVSIAYGSAPAVCGVISIILIVIVGVVIVSYWQHYGYNHLVVVEVSEKRQPPPAVSSSPLPSPLCSHCNYPLVYVGQYQRWYCYKCGQYLPQSPSV
jgi:hypothetical protein